MKNFLLPLAAFGFLASSLLFAPAASADVETRKTATYNGIKLNIPCDLNITMGKNGDTTIDADKAVLPQITVAIENGILVISAKKPLQNLNRLVVNCSTAVLDNLTLEGACKANASGFTKGRLNVVSNGASTITLKGKLNWVDLILQGASTVKATELAADGAFVKISGAGTASVNTKDKLKVKIQGAGTVKYAGNPKVEQEVLGAGTISKI